MKTLHLSLLAVTLCAIFVTQKGRFLENWSDVEDAAAVIQDAADTLRIGK